jgi:hypothetical protein
MLGAMVWALFLPNAVHAQNAFNGPGTYEIASPRSGNVLDLNQNGDAGIYLNRATGIDSQRWEVSPADAGYYFVRNALNGFALEAVVRNTSVQALRFTGSSSQQWRFSTGKNGASLIASRDGKVLEGSWKPSSNGTAVQMYSENGGDYQQFTFRQVSGTSATSNGRWNNSRNGNETTVTCSSTNGKRASCDTDTRGGVRLVRQLSSSACTQGSTWNYDARGIWVDRGCRAEFAVTSGRDNRRNPFTANRITIDTNNNISWQSQGAGNARVYTQKDNGREQLFAEGPSGSQSAPWIVRGHLYVFILRDMKGTELTRNQLDLRPSANANPRGNGNYNGSNSQPKTISSGTTISVRTNETIDAKNNDGRIFGGVVNQDVIDSNGSIAIPKGSDVELLVKTVSNNELALDLDVVTVNGQRYGIAADDSTVNGERRDGIGTNQRTGEYVGGGALLGAIIGAIAGGGKGAAIGAGAGAAAGAGTQVLTRGRSVSVPAESLLTFRLDQPLQMGMAEGVTTRDGRRYRDQSRIVR